MGTRRPCIEELSREECRRLLLQWPVGWIAHCSAGRGTPVPGGALRSGRARDAQLHEELRWNTLPAATPDAGLRT
jgi:hypothetical protein